MADYRIYFIGPAMIQGRHDFSADNDQSAVEMAFALFDACSDSCQSFDLWQAARPIPVPRLFRPTPFNQLSAAQQECVVDTEERIARSQWHVANSRRLLERLEAKRPF
ncbi:MAG TPA: hypothetical protein VGG57_22085 [Stellaceae bacterium]|jgi:hypothetical protein